MQKKKIKYKPKLNLNTSIKLTSDWYESFYKRKNMFDYSLTQIKKYFNAP